MFAQGKLLRSSWAASARVNRGIRERYEAPATLRHAHRDLPKEQLVQVDRTSASGGADTLFQIDERSKFQTQKGLIFGLV
jgi:hypothetical protein